MELFVFYLIFIEDGVPADGVGDDGGIARAIGERVFEAAEVVDRLIISSERRGSIFKVNLGQAARDGDRPKQAAGERVNAGVEVMCLIDTNCVSEHVQSDEPEGMLVDLPIDADILPLHKPHIRVEDLTASHLALNLGRAQQTVEVGNRRRLD